MLTCDAVLRSSVRSGPASGLARFGAVPDETQVWPASCLSVAVLLTGVQRKATLGWAQGTLGQHLDSLLKASGFTKHDGCVLGA